MINLDSIDEVKALDKGNVLGSIIALPDQMAQAWNEIKGREVPESCKLSKNVVVSGMGGSALGGRIVDSLMADRSRTPIEIFTEYRLPNYVNRDTFVILCSYSGNTEETLSAGREALTRGASLFCITTGGKLGQFMEDNKLDGFLINPTHNPSGQPRMGLGYSIIGVLAALAKCEFINVLDTEIQFAIDTARRFVDDYGVYKPESENLAKSFARKLRHKAPVLIASEHLLGIAHAFKNQLNENSKTFAELHDIPELNHHLMEGLRNPAEMKKFLSFVFFDSDLYSKEIKKRYELTREVVEKQEVETHVYKLHSNKKLDQIFEILTFGSFVSFYLALLYEIDPTPIPWVDYFKEKLAGVSG